MVPDNAQGHVRFERPDPASILSEGYYPADMHFHTDHTDGMVSVRSLLKRIRETGIGCAVTDHNEISGALCAYTQRESHLVIPGIEISAADGPHILVYFYSPRDLEDFFTRHIKPHRRESPWMLTTRTSEEILESTEGYSCIRGAAHPYGYFMFNSGLGKCVECGLIGESVYNRVDVIEGICANMAHSENLRAIALASRLGIPITGGTDGHVIYDLGSAVTCTTSTDPAEFLDELKRGNAMVIGQEQYLHSKIVTVAALSTRFMTYFIPSVKIHAESILQRIDRDLFHKK